MGITAIEDFLTPEDEDSIIDAIRLSELKTTGEIRVHLEKNTSLHCIDRAKEVFYKLKMNQTLARNGVLIYVSVLQNKFAVIGDQGIHAKVGMEFWKSVSKTIEKQFIQEEFSKGLVAGIQEIGAQLSHFFPWSEKDLNELDNRISKSLD